MFDKSVYQLVLAAWYSRGTAGKKNKVPCGQNVRSKQ